MMPEFAEGPWIERMEGGVLYSGGNDGNIRMWGLPNPNLPSYSKYEPRKHAISILSGHTDIVWQLKQHSVRPLLTSISADGSIRFWDINYIGEGGGVDGYSLVHGSTALKRTLYHNLSNQILPTSFDFLRTDLNKLIVSFNNSQLKLFDIETGQVIVDRFEGDDETYDQTPATQINTCIAHPTQSTVVTGHEDRMIRVFDLQSGKKVHSMVAHLDAVSSLDISPNGQVLVSGGHDCSVRLWDFQKNACIQEFSAHRKKFDEGINIVRFHPRNVGSLATSPTANVSVQGASSWLATGGADSCVKIYSM